MMTPFSHQAWLVMGPEMDIGAPGAAITLALCGSWDHSPPCRVPHHVEADRTGSAVRVRVLFATDAANEHRVRQQIDTALRDGRVTDRAGISIYWEFRSSMAAEVNASEIDHARRLSST
jgi:hypothetical protein